MQTSKRIRLIVDTNIWISSLIGKKLIGFREMLMHPCLELITTPHLIEEILIVTNRPKFQRYFHPEDVQVLINWMQDNMTCIEIGTVPQRCRDPKDDYLLELAIQSNAIYLVSGDDDLLKIGSIAGCTIMTVSQFIEKWESIINSYETT